MFPTWVKVQSISTATNKADTISDQSGVSTIKTASKCYNQYA